MTIDQITGIQASIIEHISTQGWGGYCEVASASEQGKKYRVYFNSKLYSTSCNCKAGQCSQDCGHRVAVDRHFDSRRAILGEDMPVHVEDDLRSEYEGCDFCGRNHKSWNCPF